MHKNRFADAVRFYEQLFARDPERVAKFRVGYRSEAAAAAAMAAAGRGVDPPSESERLPLRRKALAWLRADFRDWERHQRTYGTRVKASVHRAMTGWLTNPHFHSVRSPDRLANLPPDERQEWLKFWTDARRLHRQTTTPELAPPPRPK